MSQISLVSRLTMCIISARRGTAPCSREESSVHLGAHISPPTRINQTEHTGRSGIMSGSPCVPRIKPQYYVRTPHTGSAGSRRSPTSSLPFQPQLPPSHATTERDQDFFVQARPVILRHRKKEQGGQGGWQEKSLRRSQEQPAAKGPRSSTPLFQRRQSGSGSQTSPQARFRAAHRTSPSLRGQSLF